MAAIIQPAGDGVGLDAALRPILEPYRAARRIAYSPAASEILPDIHADPLRLPEDDPTIVSRLLRGLPSEATLRRAHATIAEANRTRASFEHLAQLSDLFLRCWPNLTHGRREMLVEAITFLAEDEAIIRGYSPHHVAAAWLDLAKSSRFPPTPAELLERFPAKRTLFQQAERRVGRLIEARQELEFLDRWESGWQEREARRLAEGRQLDPELTF